MTWQAQRRHQHQVESEVETREIGSLEQKGFGGTVDPSPLTGCQGRRRCGDLTPRLHFDDREHLATACQNVDLARRAAPVASQDMPATQPKVPKAEATPPSRFVG